jgi:hypothetical protein
MADIWENMADIWEFHSNETFGHMGKYGGHMVKNGEPIYDLGHMWISLELKSGKIMADISELPRSLVLYWDSLKKWFMTKKQTSAGDVIWILHEINAVITIQ